MAKASLLVNLFDGRRQLMPKGVKSLIRVRDGNQKEVSARHHTTPSVLFRVSFFDGLGDNYTVIAWRRNHMQAGFTPVRVSLTTVQTVDLMLLPKDGSFNFRAARWETLQQTHPELAQLLSAGARQVKARERYEQLMEERAAILAALLNITTALHEIHLPSGRALGYLKELFWDDSKQQDRFFAWVDDAMVNQVRLAVAQGAFQVIAGSNLFHPGATSSYKQVQFGEANVQITFHEKSKKTIRGAPCVKAEFDMDYHKDLLAHTLLEVIPNLVTGSLTDPRTIYVLRWMAGRRAGVPEFNPPYTIEA